MVMHWNGVDYADDDILNRYPHPDDAPPQSHFVYEPTREQIIARAQRRARELWEKWKRRRQRRIRLRKRGA